MLLNCHFIFLAAIYLYTARAVKLTDVCRKGSENLTPGWVHLVRQGRLISDQDVYGNDENVLAVQHPGSVIFKHYPKVANMTYELGRAPYLSHNQEEVDLGTSIGRSSDPGQVDDAFDPIFEKIEMPHHFRGCSGQDRPWDKTRAQMWLDEQTNAHDTETTPEKQWTAYGYAPLNADISSEKISPQDFVDAVLESRQLPSRDAVERNGVFFSMVQAKGQLDEDKVRNLTKALSPKMSVPKSAACARIYSYNNKLGYTFAYGLSKIAVEEIDCARFEAQKVYYTWSAPMITVTGRVIKKQEEEWAHKQGVKKLKNIIVLACCFVAFLVILKKRRQRAATKKEPLQRLDDKTPSDSENR